MKNKIKVAVVDSGIDINHDYLNQSIYGGVSFVYQDGKTIPVKNKFDDENGHGTACASIIKKECKDVQLFAVKILDSEATTNLNVLEGALKYLLESDIQLINLSLSVFNSEIVKDLYCLCQEFYIRNKIIICSLANGYHRSYPAVFNNVLGVKGFILESENAFWYNKQKNIQCIVDNNPYFYCGLHNKYQMFRKCNSQAAAKFTGIVANILSENPDISVEELHNTFEIKATRNDWSENDFEVSKRFPIYTKELNQVNNNTFELVLDVIRDVLQQSKDNKSLYTYSLLDKHNGLSYDNCFVLARQLEDVFKIKFDYMNVSRYDFHNIYSLTNLVDNYLKGNK